MRTILRNFINVLRRFKMASFLNIVGLTVAFTAFLVIMMQVKYEQTFDRCYPTASRICRVDVKHGEKDVYASILPRALADAVFTSSPHIEGSVLLSPSGVDVYVTVGEESTGKVLKNRSSPVIRGLSMCFNLLYKKALPPAWKIRRRCLSPKAWLNECSVKNRPWEKLFIVRTIYGTWIRKILLSAVSIKISLKIRRWQMPSISG